MRDVKYQVFISSTYTDLEEERESIIKAILEMYHIPIGMEMFSAEDEDQWEIIRRTIEVSDYYILILGLRYGSKTKDNISFTQKEYEYALEKNIPVLAFVMHDNVSLSKDKRDDDLTEINAFRETVLKNSKMAQFWETRDELIKNVSISLMKQIMQKPGIGWVRGDKAISSDALSQELTNMVKENRGLRKKIQELESKIVPKYPDIDLSVDSLAIDHNFDAFKIEIVPKRLNNDDIEEHLKKYISEEEIRHFNSCIPTQSAVDEYNKEFERHYKIKNYSSKFNMKVCNTGTTKANNIFIDIEFPNEVIILKVDQENEKPESPIPYNPILRAQNKYNEELQGSEITKNPFESILGLHNSGIGAILNHNINKLPYIRSNNQTWWTRLDGNKLTIKIESLLHTRCMTFDDEYLIVPLKAGTHSIKASIICEEFETPTNQTIALEVKEKP